MALIPYLSILIYLALFPFAYFRHDDWWMLGNAVRHPALDWEFLFSPTLYSNGIPEIWFLRPFFKLFLSIYYALFGFSYPLWLFATLSLVIAGCGFAARSLKILGKPTETRRLFIGIFSVSITLHAGSLLWIGEGLMNGPQVFLLSVSLYFFCRGTQEHGFHFAWALLFYLLSLGFKEAGIFHCALLFGLVFSSNLSHKFPLQTRLLWLFPYAIATLFYLIYRLGVLPFHPGYRPHFPEGSSEYLVMLVGTLSLPLIALTAAGGMKFLKQFNDWKVFLPFVLVSLFPYVGHDFFSPGWCLLPGFFFIWIACYLSSDPLPSRKRNILLALLFALNASALITRLNTMGWWDWHRPQQRLHEIFRSNSEFTEVNILTCQNPKYPKAFPERVLGHTAALSELWAIHHGKNIPIHFLPCDGPVSTDPSTLTLKLHFPLLTQVKS